MTNLFKQNLNQQKESKSQKPFNNYYPSMKQKNAASLSSDANTFFQHQDNFKQKQFQMKEDFQNYWKQRQLTNHAETQSHKSRPDQNIFKFQNSDSERFAIKKKQFLYGQDLQNTVLQFIDYRNKFQDRSYQRGHGLANLFSSPQFQTQKQIKLTPVYQTKQDLQYAAEQSLKQFNNNTYNREPEKKNESVQVSIERIADQFPSQQPYYLYNNQQPIYQNQLISPLQQQIPYSRQNQQFIPQNPQNQFQSSQQQYFLANQNNQYSPQNDNSYQFPQKQNQQDNYNHQDNIDLIPHLPPQSQQQEKNLVIDFNHEQRQQLKKLESKLDEIDPQDLSSIEKEIIKTSTYDRHYGQLHDDLSIKKLKQMHELALNRYFHRLDNRKQELEQQQDELIKQYNERMMEDEMAKKRQEEEEMLRKQQGSGKQPIINVSPPTPTQPIQQIEKEVENNSLTDLEKQFMQEQEQLRELVTKQMEENSKFLEQKKVELETDHQQKIKELEEQKKNLETKENVLEIERKDYYEKMQLLDKEILNLRSNIYQSQNGLIQELGKLKHEAINQHEERYRNKRHIDNIIEQLKQAEVNDLMREQNLMKAIKETKAFDQPKYVFSKDYENIIDEKIQKNAGQTKVPTNSKLISLNQKIRNDIYTDATNYQQRQLLPYLDKEYAYSNNLTKAIQLDKNQFPSLQNENEQIRIYNSYQRGLLPIERDERKVHAWKLAKINDDRLYELNKLEKDENQFNVIGKLDDIVYSVQN